MAFRFIILIQKSTTFDRAQQHQHLSGFDGERGCEAQLPPNPTRENSWRLSYNVLQLQHIYAVGGEELVVELTSSLICKHGLV